MNRVRGKSLISMLMVLSIFVSLAMVNIGYGQSPTVFVTPDPANADPTEHVEVNVNVTDAPELVGFQFNLRWDKKVLGFPPGPPYPGDNPLCNVTEGTFISSAGATTFTVVPNFLEASVLVGCSLNSPVGTPPSGSGTLATFRFLVVESGVSNLTLYGVKLFNYTTGGEVAGVTTDDGYFYTSKPFVDFFWTPVSPEAGEVATFNASACWDPDGGSITQYSWNWGDGSPINNTASPVMNHTFTSYNETGYHVTLTVTDDEADTWSKTQIIPMWHELVSNNIWPAIVLPYGWWFMDTVDRKIIRGEYIWILGTVVNTGTYAEDFNVTMTAKHVATNTTVDLEWAWGGGTVVPMSLGTGTAGGSGWDLMFEWITDDALEGDWEIMLAATSVSGEVNTANNVKVLTMEILPYGELSESLDELISRTLDLSGRIDLQDIILAAMAFGATPGDPDYNPLADFNGDGIDIFDLVQIAIQFGLEW
jgi:hypothetical protein